MLNYTFFINYNERKTANERNTSTNLNKKNKGVFHMKFELVDRQGLHSTDLNYGGSRKELPLYTYDYPFPAVQATIE